MVFLIAMALALVLVLAGGNALKKHPRVFYCCALAVDVAVVLGTWRGVRFPAWFGTWIWPVFARGALAGALFILVMAAGAFPPKSRGQKLLIPLRGELSILASLLTLGHNTAYGKTYFVLLFSNPGRLPVNQLLAAVLSVCMILIMLPLFVTSFPAVRRRMGGRRWKRLQRWAYLFYGMLCAHILLLTIPYALQGRPGYRLTVFVYSGVFFAYAICRVLKALAREKKAREALPRRQLIGLICGLLLAAALTGSVTLLGAAARKKPASESTATQTPEAATTETAVSDAAAADEGEETGSEGESEKTEAENTEEKRTAEDEAPAGSYRDGVYTGSAMGNNGEITVEVEIAGGEMTAIRIIGFMDDPAYFDEKADGGAMIGEMLSKQSPEIDTISGATYSSGALIDAVKAALEAASVSVHRSPP